MNESEIREALRAEAASTTAHRPDWDEVASRGQLALDRRRRVQLVASGVAAALVLVVGVLVAVGASRGDGRQLRAVDSTSPGPSLDTTPSTQAPTYDDRAEGIWPLASQTDLDLYEQSGSTEYDAPETTARSFLEVYVGMKRLSFGTFSEVQPVDGRRQGEIRAAAGDVVGLPMAVHLAQVSPGGAWTVTGVTCDSIVVEAPAPVAVIPSPVEVRGRASAFEGTVHVEVRQDGQVAGERLGEGFVTGSGDATLGPFSGAISYSPAERPGGAVLFIEFSAEDSSPIRVAAVRVHFA